jgi:hypothetical protein
MEIDKLEYYIGQRLITLTDINVYNKKAPDKDDIFPYLVYKFYACNYSVRHRKDWVLEIDYWNDSNDDTNIIEASINVKNGRTIDEVNYIGLNKSTQNEVEGFYQCHIDFEGSIPDTEPNISRYNQRYIVKVD